MFRKKKFLLAIIALLLIIIATQIKIMIQVYENRNNGLTLMENIKEEFIATAPIKKSALIENVPHIMQKPELDRGCEVTSLAMLLQYYGYDVTKMKLAKEIDKEPFESNGFKGDMRKGFVGNMETFNQPGIGVYQPPIEKLAKKYAGKNVVSLNGKDPSRLYKAVANDQPVWVITNASLKKLPESSFQTWTAKDGNYRITYSMHSVVITGYDSKYVYVNDPLNQLPNTKVNKKDFEEAWIQMGSQAITIKK